MYQVDVGARTGDEFARIRHEVAVNEVDRTEIIAVQK